MKFAKVMFLQVSVILSTGGVADVVAPGGMHGCSWGACMVAPGGHAWLLLGGACMVALGGHAWLLQGRAWLLRGWHLGCSRGHAWLLQGGHAWLLWGACVVAPGAVCVVFLMRYGQ